MTKIKGNLIEIFVRSHLHINERFCTKFPSKLHETIMEVSSKQSLNSALILSFFIIFLTFSSIPAHALNIGVQATDAAVTLSKECSRKCESEFCSEKFVWWAVPPFLRYGKYCGLLYSGCPGEKPCDGLDACCMKHDACVQFKNNEYLSQECSEKFIKCMKSFKKTGGRGFKGNTCEVEKVIDVLSVVMEAALLAGRYLHKP